jgi:hypothetical protein
MHCKNNMKYLITSFAALASLSFAGSVNAATLISNLGEAPSSNTTIGYHSSAESTYYQLGQSFTTSSSDWVVSDISLMLGDGTVNQSLSLSLYTASSVDGKVGSLVGTFSPAVGDDFTTDYSLHTFTPSSALTLNANTTYYMILSDGLLADDAEVKWDYSGTTGVTEGVGTISGSGTYYTYCYTDSTTGADFAYDYGFAQYFSISGSSASVPEPAAYAAFFGAAVLGFAAIKRRKNAVR